MLTTQRRSGRKPTRTKRCWSKKSKAGSRVVPPVDLHEWHEYAASAVCDGGIDRNPGGAMHWTVVVLDSSGELVDARRVEPHEPPGYRSNNVAEFYAAIDAARMLVPYAEGGGRTRIVTDSQVLVHAVRSRRSKRPHLQALLGLLLEVLDRTGTKVVWAPRSLAVEFLGH